MNKKFKEMIKNIYYTVVANGISMIISTLITLIIPKYLGVQEYGYWQLYTLYISYVGFFAFGWCDGIYLRYGGYRYDELKRKTFVSQYWFLTIFEVLLSVVLFIAAKFYIDDANKQFIMYMTIICGLITILKSFILLILQATNRIKEYARYMRINQYIYIAITFGLLIIGVRSFKVLLIIDVISKMIAFLLCINCCKEIIWGNFAPLIDSIKEVKENVSSGIKLMLANIASSLIIGIVRLGIEKKWDISTFGRISLTLSISNLLVSFINAIGVVMYPMLRRTPEDQLPRMYKLLRTLLMTFLLFVMILYYPFKIIISIWLPDYANSLVYMALLFPVCIYESHMALLVNTYLKTLRKEKIILYINALTVVLSLMLTAINIVIIGSLTITIISIMLLITFRCIVAEIFVTKFIKISIKKDIIMESIVCAIFVISSWFIGGVIGLAIYCIVYFAYVIAKKHEILETLTIIKGLIWGNNKKI